METVHYVTVEGQDPFQDWLDAVKAKDKRAAARILTRINRLEAGNRGDCKSVGGAVHELRIDYGPGYRVYFSQVGNKLVMLLTGGQKKSQQGDIDLAKEFLKDFRRRQNESS